MKIKFLVFILIMIARLNPGFTQCNISSSTTFSYYSKGIVNSLMYQSSISSPSIYGKACDGMFTSLLTQNEISTSFIDAGPLRQIDIFPNPVYSLLNITWNGIDLDCRVELGTTLGVKLKTYHRDKNESISRLELQDLSPGFYVLIIRNASYQHSIKILKL